MTRNEVMIHSLCEEISKYDSFVLYGAGYVANVLLEALGKKYIPAYCLVTDKSGNPKRLNDIPVYELNEKIMEIKLGNILVLVSVSEPLENEIVNILHDNNIENIILSSHFFWTTFSEKTFQTIYKNKDFTWYISKVEEWCLKRHGRNVDFTQLCKNTKENPNRIILVIENFAPRVVKIAHALMDSGKDVIVILNQKMNCPIWSKFYSSLSKRNIKQKFYDSIEELLFLILQNKGEVIHTFSNSFDPYTAYVLVKNQEYIGKVVYETYDIANGFYNDFDEEKLSIERYCLENASGVCYREFSLDYLVNELQLKIQKNSIRFWDYCSDENINLVKQENNQELSICYAGGVVTEDEYPDCPFGGFLAIADWCNRNKCHLHIYPSVWDEERYQKYIEKDKNDLYFHFHKTIPYSELIEEISQYDYGITPTIDEVWDEDVSGYNTKSKYIYSGTNKYFDYLDAGLPIISAIPQKFAQYLEEKGVLINWTNGQYDIVYLEKNKDMMHRKVHEVREELKISNNIYKLIDFYNAI